jgi:hypothetical protein
VNEDCNSQADEDRKEFSDLGLDFYCPFYKRVSEDFLTAFQIYEFRNHDPFACRLIVRAVINSIEGHLACIREQLTHLYDIFLRLSQEDEPSPRFERMERLLNIDLSVKNYFRLVGKRLSDIKKGNLNPRDEFLCVEETLRMIFSIHGMIFHHEIMPDFASDGWRMFLAAKKRRNRLTHPSIAEDLDVSTEEAHQALLAHLWLQEHFTLLSERTAARLRQVLGPGADRIIALLP